MRAYHSAENNSPAHASSGSLPRAQNPQGPDAPGAAGEASVEWGVLWMGRCLVRGERREKCAADQTLPALDISSFVEPLVPSSCPTIPGELGQGQRCEDKGFSLLPVWPQRTITWVWREEDWRGNEVKEHKLCSPPSLPQPLLPTPGRPASPSPDLPRSSWPLRASSPVLQLGGASFSST